MKIRENGLKVSFRKPTYIIKENEKIVICFVESCLNGTSDGYELFWDFNTTKGIAKCAENDIFDVEIGKRIALAKAENNAYIKACKKVEQKINKNERINFICENFLEKSLRTIITNRNHIEKYD